MGLPTLGPDEDTKELTKRIVPPNGVSPSEWYALIEFAAQNYTLTAGLAKPEKAVLRALDVDDTVSERTWNLVFDFPTNYEKFMQALAVRGVEPLGRGLTARQILVIDILTNPNIPGTWNTKLKKAGVSEMQLSLWMESEIFAGQFKMLTQKRMNQALPAVDVVVATKALSGEMDAVKYLDKKMGRDPDKKEEMSNRQLVAIVIDALSKHLLGARRCTCGPVHDDSKCSFMSGPDQLRTIAAEIEVRMKADG
jgi:hypothetical protein